MISGAVLAVMCASLSLPAQAQGPTQFASFTQASLLNTPFRFINNGAATGSVFGLYDAGGAAISIPVNFQFQIPNAYGSAVGENIAATMTMTSTVLTPDDGVGNLDVAMQNITIQFNANTPAPGGLTNLLTLDFTTGALTGNLFTSNASLQGTESATATDNVEFTSDFLDFSGVSINKNYTLSFSNVQPSVARDPNNYFRSFIASGTGAFGSEPLPTTRVPEPGTLALLALGILSGAALRKRRA